MIFDAHGDILTDIYEETKRGKKDIFNNKHLALYKEGGVTHSIFVNWTDPNSDDDTQFQNIFDIAIKEIEHNDNLMICLNHHDMIQSMSLDKIGVILGIEGVKQLKDINELHSLYNRGVRHASLTWNEQNKYASGLDDTELGLTQAGKELIIEMEQLGMIIDLAHTNEHTFKDIVSLTKKPVIISHGNTKALCSHRRNYTDEQLQLIKEKNGVIGICGIAPFVSDQPENQSISYMAQHIKYVKDLIGIDHVGLGFDLCYYLFEAVSVNNLDGLNRMSDAKNIIEELKKLDFTKEEIEKVTHLNFERVIKEILG